MRFKCPGCRRRTIGFRRKLNLAFGGKAECPDCHSAIKVEHPATLAVLITILIMMGAPLFIAIPFAKYGLWVTLIAIVGFFVLVVCICTVMCTLWEDENASSGDH